MIVVKGGDRYLMLKRVDFNRTPRATIRGFLARGNYLDAAVAVFDGNREVDETHYIIDTSDPTEDSDACTYKSYVATGDSITRAIGVSMRTGKPFAFEVRQETRDSTGRKSLAIERHEIGEPGCAFLAPIEAELER
ncbi:MAG TPA: hypothetical protein VGC41_10510 [Kofleriaceae bacterium]